MSDALKSDRSGLPTPKGRLPVLGHSLRIGPDLLLRLDRWAEELGDVYRVDIPGRPTCVLNRPDEIERVLVHGQAFVKPVDLRRASAVFGQGLFVSEGELWKKQRHLMQPLFHRERVAAYGQRMVDLTEQMLATWVPGEVRDLHQEALALALKIATDALFGDAEAPSQEVALSLEAIAHRFDGIKAVLPSWLLPVSSLKYQKAMARLDKVVYNIIARRRAQKEETGDLLSILLHAQDDEGSGMSDRQLRDEVMTLLLAGHETTANILTWAWHLLAQNPDTERPLLEEADALGRAPTTADMPRLPYAAAVANESMRLYPPAWLVSREVVTEWEIDGCRLERGVQVTMSPWVVQRDRRFFPDPLEFRPARWLDGSTKSLPTYTYFPFGGGQRLCIGRPFALLEMPLVLATVAQRYQPRSVPGHKVVPRASLVLRPGGGLPMRLERR